MPKPTFLQSVLGKPSRSYADPYAPSPWADAPEPEYAPPSSRYSSRVDRGVHLGFRDEYAHDDYSNSESGPSQPARKPRRARSVVFTEPKEEPYMASRFPKPRKAQSTVGLREPEPRLALGGGKGSVKRKKKKKVEGSVGDAASVRSAAGRRQESWREDEDGQSQYSLERPQVVGHRQRESSNSSSSAASSTFQHRPAVNERESSPLAAGAPRAQRPKVNAIHKVVAGGGGAAPPTPPSSEPSSSRSSREKVNTASRSAKEAAEGLARSDTAKSAKTVRPQPQSQPRESPHEESIPTQPHIPLPPAIIEPLTPTEDPTSGGNAEMFMLNVQPPTPAPYANLDETPFHKENLPQPSYELGAAYVSPSRPVDHVVPSSQAEHTEADYNSEHGEAGSGDEAESTGPPASASASVPAPNGTRRNGGSPSPSRAPSIAHTAPLLGTSVSRNSFSGAASSRSSAGREHRRQASAQLSEASYGGARSIREGSIRSSGSGFGKGGWAVAASATQSGRNTPVQMFLPSGANSGWGEFQVPIPQPRQSKFTPLPAAYQPPTFDRLVNGDRTPGGSAASGSGRYSVKEAERGLAAPVFRRSGSAPSTYSQESESEEDSEDDGLPRPSRSYAQQVKEAYVREHGDGSGRSPETHHGEWSTQERSRRYSNGPLIPPKDPRRTSASPQSEYTSEFPSNGLQRGALSRSSHSDPIPPEQSESDDEDTRFNGRPASSFSRALSPTPSLYDRGGTGAFPRPAFLDPDVITLLPEMTEEDSERLYRPPSPSERDGPSRRKSWKPAERALSALGQRRPQSVIGDNPERRPASAMGSYRRGSRVDGDDGDGEERGSRRAKSVMGFRGGDRGEGSRWEGSSYGDGVLMQSDGREGSRGGSYNTMVLPAGAFVPSDPNRKRTSIIDSRVLGLPHTTMATLCLSSSAHRLPMTPLHLRGNLPPPVDFTSHVKPPAKVGSRELLVQVYAVAVDQLDVRTVEEKGKGDVGRWVPGRSFVGRCLEVGKEEKEITRGEIVVGLLDIRKSGALAEYIVCDRRRLSRAPHPTTLSLEQLALLPLYGIPATRAVRGHLTRATRALIMDAHEGTAALICQEMSRAGVNVTALIGGGEAHHDNMTRCLQSGARGVLTGAPAAVMLGLDEDAWDLVVDTKGTQRVYDAAKRMLKDGGKIISLVAPEHEISTPSVKAAAKPSGFRTLRAAFSTRRKNTKFVNFTYFPPAGSGEAEVDTSGMDVRDVLEEPCMTSFRPDMPVEGVWAFERGMEAFRTGLEGGDGEKGVGRVGVVRIIN